MTKTLNQLITSKKSKAKKPSKFKASINKPGSKSKAGKSKAKKVISPLKYILKCLPADGLASNNFNWDMTVGAKVSAPDWDPTPECGKGLHGWLSGEGDPTASIHHTDPTAVWLILSTDAEVVDLEGKVKFPHCTVEFVGNREEAVAEMRRLVPTAAVMYSTVTIKNGEEIRVGDYSTVNAGNHSKVTAGYNSTVTAKNYCTVNSGMGCIVNAGNNCTVTAGEGCKVTAGNDSNFSIKCWDDKKYKYRVVVSYVGESGILPGLPYKVVDGKAVPA
jgi:hypothetical protein